MLAMIHDHCQMNSPPSKPQLNWISGFVGFLSEVTAHKPAKAFQNVITVDASVARRIGLGGGVKDKVAPFLALQPYDMAWFAKMPWHEFILEQDAIVLIAIAAEGNVTTPPFGIRIPISPDYAKVLARFRSLDVRQISINRDGIVSDLADSASLRIPLIPGKVERLGQKPKIQRFA